MSKKPNLFIIGAPKCGTTAWYEYLRRHPEISFSEKKEPHYFSKDFPDFRWAKTEQEYLDLFRDLPDTQYVGEASVMYLYSKVAIQNVFNFNPDAKILIFVRSYEKFFQSYHSQIFMMHDESVEDLREAWRLQQDRARGEFIPSNCRDSAFLQYKEVGKFGDQIERVLKTFPREQVKITVFEDWVSDPKKTYAEFMDFLGLENDGFNDFRQVNVKRKNRSHWLDQFIHRPPEIVLALASLFKKITGKKRLGLGKKVRKLNQTSFDKHRDLPPDLADEILDWFSDDRAKLERLLGRTIETWKTRQPMTPESIT